nr:hypothetical protein [Ardenticatenales bacterium]
MTPQYKYPQRWYAVLHWLPLVFAGLVAAQTLWLWIRIAATLIGQWFSMELGAFWLVEGPLLAVGLGSLITLLLALLLALLLSNLLLPLTLGEQGLYVHGLRGTRVVAWEHLKGFYGTRIGESARTLLFVRATKGAPWYSRLHGLAVGAGFTPGFLFTSDLEEFPSAMGYALRMVEAEQGMGAVRFQEEIPGPFLAIVTTPEHQISALWPKDRMGTLDVPAMTKRAARLAVVFSLAAPLVLLVDGLTKVEFPILGTLLLFAIGMAEWPLGSYWFVTVGDILNKPTTFREMLPLYPDTQLPRWIMVLVCLIFLLLGLPVWTLVLPIGAAMLWSAGVLRLLTEHLYDVEGSKSWLGTALPVIYQLFLY